MRSGYVTRAGFAHRYAQSPERLTKPLIRKNGKLVKASWNVALQMAAEGLKKAGSQSIGIRERPPDERGSIQPARLDERDRWQSRALPNRWREAISHSAMELGMGPIWASWESEMRCSLSQPICTKKPLSGGCA